MRPIRVAYADPPYLGHAKDYAIPGTKEYHPDALRWDDPEEHARLMARLEEEYPDGWALSLAAESVRHLYHRSPPRARLAPWVTTSTGALKMFRVAFCWEGVLYSSPFLSRSQAPGRPSQLDWIAAGKGHNSDVEGDFLGAKPRRFCFWLFRLMGLGGHPEDELVDLFPGSGAVTRAWDDFRAANVRAKDGLFTQRALFGAAS